MCECQQAIFAGESTIHSGVSFVNVGIKLSSIAHGRVEYIEGSVFPRSDLLEGDVSAHVSEPNVRKGPGDTASALISSGQ